jgi:hypothetical protein
MGRLKGQYYFRVLLLIPPALDNKPIVRSIIAMVGIWGNRGFWGTGDFGGTGDLGEQGILGNRGFG